MTDTTKTTIGFVPTVDVDLSQPLDWPNADGSVTTWPPADVRDLEPKRAERRTAGERRVSLTPAGEILVEVTFTEGDALELAELVELAGPDDGAHQDQLDRIRAILDTSVRLARHHALTRSEPPLTSGQRQGYIDTGLIEPPLDSYIERARELALDESIAEGIDE